MKRLNLIFEDRDSQTLLDLLNRRLLKRPSQWAEFWSVTPATVTRNESAYRTATREVQRLLTEWVNQWIDSGCSSDGTEAPTKRNLKAAPEVLRVLKEFQDIARVRFSFVQGFPDAELSSWRSGEGSLAEDRPVERDPYSHAEYEAAHILAMMMLSVGWRSRIARCRNPKCNRYFFLLKGSKQVWADGCFCSTTHRTSVTSASYMDKRRRAIRELHIKWAAEELLKLEAKDTLWDEGLKNKLVAAVNRHRKHHRLIKPSERGIRINTITRYQKQIQSKANQINQRRPR